MRQTHRLLCEHLAHIREIALFSRCKFVFIFESNLAFESQHLLHAVQQAGIKNWVSLSEGQQGSLGWLTTAERKVRALEHTYTLAVAARTRVTMAGHGAWCAVTDTLSVSANGFVETHCRNHGHRIYKPTTQTLHGYVVFKHDGKSCRFHRLVCTAFHGEPPFPGAVVDHINRNILDNRAANLRWATRSQNVQNTIQPVRRKLNSTEESQKPLDGEEWRLDGRFKVSSMGRARIQKSHNKRPDDPDSWHPIFTPRPVGSSPYARLGKSLFHAMVANAFLRKPEGQSLTIDHINQDRSDNRVSNLRWATKKQQIENRTVVKKASCLSTPVKALDPVTGKWQHYVSFADAARSLRQKHGKPFNHVNVARAVRKNKPYNNVRFAFV